jgi:hypothetical protein
MTMRCHSPPAPDRSDEQIEVLERRRRPVSPLLVVVAGITVTDIVAVVCSLIAAW